MAIMKKSNKEDAVSPVIGVMLMLVVTIVIAAVVAAFASGLGGDMESAPSAVLSVDVLNTKVVSVQHLSGENLLIPDMQVKVQNPEGTINLEGKFTGSGFFTPGMTLTSSTLTGTGADNIKSGTYVTVLIIYDGKHVIVNKDVMVS